MQRVSAGLIIAILLLSAPLAAGDGLHDEFAAARPALHRQLHSRNVEERTAALQVLRKYPLADAVRMVHACFVDEDPAVRRSAYATLLATNGEQEVCDTLVDLAAEGLKDRNGPLLVAPALAALLSSNLPMAQLRAKQLLDNKVGHSKFGPEILVLLADNLGADGKRANVMPLARLSNTRPFAEHFGVQRAVVNALTKIPDKQSIGSLIGMMGCVGGEAKADAMEHLAQVTGQIFGMDAAAWGRWWSEAGDAFEYPSTSRHAPYRTVATESHSGSYYGMPLFAERLVFVLDISGSMQGGRIMAAQRELVRAIDGLPGHVHFGVVVFNGEVGCWQKKLVPADDKAKKAAAVYVSRQMPHSNTASYDALEVALQFDTEAIYFLSDGAPTSGKILAPVDIVAAISRLNKTRRISIYTIGIAPGFPGSPTDVFLKALSEQNMGQYRRVDG